MRSLEEKYAKMATHLGDFFVQEKMDHTEMIGAFLYLLKEIDVHCTIQDCPYLLERTKNLLDKIVPTIAVNRILPFIKKDLQERAKEKENAN